MVVAALVGLILAFLVLVGNSIPLAYALDGNLYVGSMQTSEVKRYNGTTGAFIDNFVQAGSGGLNLAGGLAFGPDGNLYVINDGIEKISRYNGTTGAFMGSFVKPPNNGTDFSPFGLTFGPDGNLYVSNGSAASGGAPTVQRYNGTTGSFIDDFVAKNNNGALFWPAHLTFGPDGNLYVMDIGHIAAFSEPNPPAVKRYNGTTGAFIDNFVPNHSGGLSGIDAITFGPDRNLYVASSSTFDIKRYNGTTGTFIDDFVAFSNSGGLKTSGDLTFGPDGNLYVSSYSTNEVKRYNGTTGAFIDNFVVAGSGGLDVPSGLAFATRVPQTQTHTLTISAVDLSGNPIQGVWTVIRTAPDGAILKTGFTPFTFTGESGVEYKVSVANYDGKIFQHWNDTGSTINMRTISIPAGHITLTATYDTGDSLRGFTSLTYTGTTEQPDLTVNAVLLDGNKTLHMWTVIDPQSTDTTASSTTYKVYAGNFQNIVFDHWSDNNRERIRELTISNATAITAFYTTEITGG